jgi:hypothetical protein
MILKPNATPSEGWQGGFLKKHPELNYPGLSLEKLPMTDNLDNIKKITRQQRVLWPEFTWETQKGERDPKRCFQMFAPDISRVGYSDDGQSWSLICPQQGIFIPGFGALNVEVTVTGQRGWVDESNKTMAVDMTVKPKVWFSPSANQSASVQLLWWLFEKAGFDFPSDKSRAIEINTFQTTNQKQPIIAIRDGLFLGDKNPSFTDHSKNSWQHANLEVEIGPIDVNKDPIVAEFDTLIMKAFNLASGNMLQEGNLLAWNLWFDAPSLVDQTEWENHAEKWRTSLDAEHISPDGNGTLPKYSDGSSFKPNKELVSTVTQEIIQLIKNHL